MAKHKQFILRDDELQTIGNVIRHDKRAKVMRRATALRLLHEGHPHAQVAELMQVSQATVYNWHHNWQTEGLAGLEPHAPPGRPARAGAAYWQAIEAAVESDPQALVYPFTIWTLERLRDHVAR